MFTSELCITALCVYMHHYHKHFALFMSIEDTTQIKGILITWQLIMFHKHRLQEIVIFLCFFSFLSFFFFSFFFFFFFCNSVSSPFRIWLQHSVAEICTLNLLKLKEFWATALEPCEQYGIYPIDKMRWFLAVYGDLSVRKYFQDKDTSYAWN